MHCVDVLGLSNESGRDYFRQQHLPSEVQARIQLHADGIGKQFRTLERRSGSVMPPVSLQPPSTTAGVRQKRRVGCNARWALCRSLAHKKKMRKVVGKTMRMV